MFSLTLKYEISDGRQILKVHGNKNKLPNFINPIFMRSYLTACSKMMRLSLLYCHHWGFPSDSDGKESAGNAGDLGLIPGLGRSH